MPSELTHTKPHPDCAHPEFWSAPDAEATETEVSALIAAFVTALKPRLVVETGTYNGDTTEAIAKAARRNVLTGPTCRIVTLELDPTKAAAAQRRLKPFGVEVVCTSSLAWLPPGPIDFLFCDSDVKVRADEVRRFRPFLHRDSLVGFHDTRYLDVYRGMSELVNEGVLYPPLDLPTPRGVAFARVRV